MSAAGIVTAKALCAVAAVLAAAAVVGVLYLGRLTDPVVTLGWDLDQGTAAAHEMGPPSARIEIMVFADFECEGCAHWAKTSEPFIRRLAETGAVKLRFYDYPVTFQYVNTLSAHVAAGCAAEQGRFWEMHDKLYAERREWITGKTQNPKKVFKRYARLVGVDPGRWDECYRERRPLPRIMANERYGERLGVRGVPAVQIGNKFVPPDDVLSYDRIKARLDSMLRDTLAQVTPVKDRRIRHESNGPPLS